jgi:FixJ family two-component response regulator
MVKEKSMVCAIDHESVRKSLSRLFRSVGLTAEIFSGPEEFLAVAKQEENSCVVADLRMSGFIGLELEKEMAHTCLRIPVIMISAREVQCED